jgi:hypothetical protein
MTEKVQCDSCGNFIEVDDPKPVIVEGERIEVICDECLPF